MIDSDANAILLKFGSKVKRFRKEKLFSQEALAQTCDLDRTYIGGVERGERNIGLINVYRISNALGVPVTKLFDDE